MSFQPFLVGKCSCSILSQGMGTVPRLPELQEYLDKAFRHRLGMLGCPGQGLELDFDAPCGSLPARGIPGFVCLFRETEVVGGAKRSFLPYRLSPYLLNSWTIKRGFRFPSVQQKPSKSCCKMQISTCWLLPLPWLWQGRGEGTGAGSKFFPLPRDNPLDPDPPSVGNALSQGNPAERN